MKKTILLSAIIGCSILATAQQTITGSSAVGYSVTFAAATPATASTVPVGIVGANVTWNCANLQTANQIFTLNLSNPSGQPYFSDYPSSNISLNASVMGTVVVNDFLILNNDSMVKLGGHVPGSSYEIYDNPQLEYKFPFNFNDVSVNKYSKTSYNANGSVSSTQTGSVTLSYDGYGTLILPAGTFTNVAMLKRVRTNSIGPTTTSYSWVKYPSGERLLEYDGNGGPKVSYVYSLNTSGFAHLSADNNTSVYPTVTDKTVNIRSEKEIESVKVFDACGRLVQSWFKENQKSCTIDLTGEKGIYLLEITGKSNSFRSCHRVILN